MSSPAQWWNSREAEAASIEDSELKLIPLWSMILAGLLFIGVQYVFHVTMPHHGHELAQAAQGAQNAQAQQAALQQQHGPHVRHDLLPVPLMMGYAWGTLWASYALLLGYVSRDARRRGMSVGMWMVVCLMLPGGLGAVVYFLLRQPVLTNCPNCRSRIAANYHFCPQCQFQVAPVCGVCHRSVRITDVYCTQCGHDLAEDGAPQRLRVYSD
jgi:hypothetical protein